MHKEVITRAQKRRGSAAYPVRWHNFGRALQPLIIIIQINLWKSPRSSFIKMLWWMKIKNYLEPVREYNKIYWNLLLLPRRRRVVVVVAYCIVDRKQSQRVYFCIMSYLQINQQLSHGFFAISLESRRVV